MNTYAILRRNGFRTGKDLEIAGARSASVADAEFADDIRWIRSYALAEKDGTVGTICIYQATSPEAIEAHARRAELPCDAIIPIDATIVVRPDP